MIILQVTAAFFATISFAILFHIPKDEYICAGITGAVGWLVYLTCMEIHPSATIASFTAALALTLLSRAFAVYRKTPITIFLICGIFPLVPGAGIYYTAYHFIMGEYWLAASKGIETLKIAVAIAVAIAFIFSLPHSLFKKILPQRKQFKK